MRSFEAQFVRSMAAKTMKLNMRLRTLRDPHLQSRLLGYFLQLPRTEEGVVTLPFSRTDLANFLGVQRTSLSRALHAMEAEGIIRLQGRDVTLVDFAATKKKEEDVVDRKKTMRQLCADEPHLEAFLQSKGFPFSVDNPITELVTFEDVAAVQGFDLDLFLEEFAAYKRACP